VARPWDALLSFGVGIVAEELCVSVVVVEQISLFTDQLDCRLMQREKIV